MFMNDVNKKEEIRNVAIQDLRSFGIKFRPKKQRHHVQETRVSRRVFKTALHLLPMQTVTLTSGQQLVVPKLVHDLCSFILTKVEMEGLFRKGGSKARQNEIRLSLDAGCSLGEDHHEVDVANVLKTFFRELPEPLFPFAYHEPFLRCTLLQENKLQALLLTCLLLPSEHLNTLAYFMQFLHSVTEYSALNKMDSYNLAVVVGPTMFPMEEKIAANTTHRLTKICELFKLLIENACDIGVISEDIIDRIAPFTASSNSLTDDETSNKRKKKRRSGSLTRMFNGLRKMVGSKSSDTVSLPILEKPDLLLTPNLTKSAKKRKLEAVGFSNKKKRELLQGLPQGTALSTPISVNPNPKKTSPPTSTCKTAHCITKEKKSQWNLGSKRNKHSKQNDDAVSVNSNAFSGTKAVLERRWSAVSQAAGFKRNKMRNSCGTTSLDQKKTAVADPHIIRESRAKVLENCDTVMEKKQTTEPDYVKISRTEYEEIKNRVSEIERRISIELDNFEDGQKPSSLENADVIVKVQTAYEKTLVEAEPLSPTTDQLARRLSRELKIRRSCEQKVVRSPSARKIGSLRRRSRERQNAKIQRNKSWHIENVGIVPRINLKRGRPNTVMTGLRHPTPLKGNDTDCTVESQLGKIATRAASFHGEMAQSPSQNCQRSISNLQISCNISNSSSSLVSEKWTSADGFFSQLKTCHDSGNLINGRASLAKLRSQNAGMVLAKARLFDGLIDSDTSVNSQNSSTTSIPKVKTQIGTKIGATRNIDKHRIRSLRYDEKHLNRQSISPRKKYLKSPKGGCGMNVLTPFKSSVDDKENQVQTESYNNTDFLGSTEKAQIAALKDCNRIKTVSPGYVTPKGMPQIKRSLTVKSPKRLCRTPLGNENKQTPLKILVSSKRVY